MNKKKSKNKNKKIKTSNFDYGGWCTFQHPSLGISLRYPPQIAQVRTVKSEGTAAGASIQFLDENEHVEMELAVEKYPRGMHMDDLVQQQVHMMRSVLLTVAQANHSSSSSNNESNDSNATDKITGTIAEGGSVRVARNAVIKFPKGKSAAGDITVIGRDVTLQVIAAAGQQSHDVRLSLVRLGRHLVTAQPEDETQWRIVRSLSPYYGADDESSSSANRGGSLVAHFGKRGLQFELLLPSVEYRVRDVQSDTVALYCVIEDEAEVLRRAAADERGGEDDNSEITSQPPPPALCALLVTVISFEDMQQVIKAREAMAKQIASSSKGSKGDENERTLECCGITAKMFKYEVELAGSVHEMMDTVFSVTDGSGSGSGVIVTVHGRRGSDDWEELRHGAIYAVQHGMKLLNSSDESGNSSAEVDVPVSLRYVNEKMGFEIRVLEEMSVMEDPLGECVSLSHHGAWQCTVTALDAERNSIDDSSTEGVDEDMDWPVPRKEWHLVSGMVRKRWKEETISAQQHRQVAYCTEVLLPTGMSQEMDQGAAAMCMEWVMAAERGEGEKRLYRVESVVGGALGEWDSGMRDMVCALHSTLRIL